MSIFALLSSNVTFKLIQLPPSSGTVKCDCEVWGINYASRGTDAQSHKWTCRSRSSVPAPCRLILEPHVSIGSTERPRPYHLPSWLLLARTSTVPDPRSVNNIEAAKRHRIFAFIGFRLVTGLALRTSGLHEHLWIVHALNKLVINSRPDDDRVGWAGFDDRVQSRREGSDRK